MIYVITIARDADTEEAVVIWMPNVYSDKCSYYTMSKRSFCGYIFVDGVHQPKFRQQTSDTNRSVSNSNLRGGWFRPPDTESGCSR